MLNSNAGQCWAMRGNAGLMQGNVGQCGAMRGKVEQSCAMLQQPKRQASGKRREEKEKEKEAKLKSRAAWQAAS